jgi:hypothetical protein
MKGSDMLERFYLFRDAAADDLLAIGDLVTRERYAPLQLIFREGDDAHAMYFIELGAVSILNSGSTSSPRSAAAESSASWCSSTAARGQPPPACVRPLTS